MNSNGLTRKSMGLSASTETVYDLRNMTPEQRSLKFSNIQGKLTDIRNMISNLENQGWRNNNEGKKKKAEIVRNLNGAINDLSNHCELIHEANNENSIRIDNLNYSLAQLKIYVDQCDTETFELFISKSPDLRRCINQIQNVLNNKIDKEINHRITKSTYSLYQSINETDKKVDELRESHNELLESQNKLVERMNKIDAPNKVTPPQLSEIDIEICKNINLGQVGDEVLSNFSIEQKLTPQFKKAYLLALSYLAKYSESRDCVLIYSGKKFDIDSYLKNTRLKKNLRNKMTEVKNDISNMSLNELLRKLNELNPKELFTLLGEGIMFKEKVNNNSKQYIKEMYRYLVAKRPQLSI